MKHCRIVLGCMLASLCLLSGGAWAQVVTEFSAGISAGSHILAMPEMIEWTAAAKLEPEEIDELDMEF